MACCSQVNIDSRRRGTHLHINQPRTRVLVVDARWHLVEPIRKSLTSVKHFIVMKDSPDAQIPRGDPRLEGALVATHPVETGPKLDETDAPAMCYTPAPRASQGRGLQPAAVSIPLLRLVHGGRARHHASESHPAHRAHVHATPGASLRRVMNGSTRSSAGQPAAGAHHRDRSKRALHPGRARAQPCGSPIQASSRRARLGHLVDPLHPHRRLRGARSLIELLRKETRLHAPRWGMTEIYPSAPLSPPALLSDSLPDDERYNIRAKQGAMVAGRRHCASSTKGKIQRGTASAWAIQVRGPWSLRYYKKTPRCPQFTQSVVPHGRLGSIDPEGYVRYRPHQGPDQVRGRVDLERGTRRRASGTKVMEAAVIASPTSVAGAAARLRVPKPEHQGSLTEKRRSSTT